MTEHKKYLRNMSRLQNKSLEIFVVIGFVFLLNSICVLSQNVDPGDPVYLTPLIRAGEIERAQEAALVKDFPVPGYSGFITVNEEFNSNLFFWFFPAEGSYENGNFVDNDFPVILWNDGGPGISGFFSIFGQNGPFLGDGSNGVNYTLNPFSWHKKYHMIYMDNPVEVGFSHTSGGYVHSEYEAARDLYEFLTQFLTLFPHLQSNPFYNGGASYGAKYAIETAHLIHEKNSNNPVKFINLTGVILDSPWIDPYTQAQYGEFLFHVGLINRRTWMEFSQKEQDIKVLIDDQKYLEAFRNFVEITGSDLINATGFNGLQNIYRTEQIFVNMTEFAVANSTRRALHVGSQEFHFISPAQQSRMHPNFMRSSVLQLDSLLNTGYQVLLYVGNMDGSTGHLGVERMLETLTWSGSNDLIDGNREILTVRDIVTAYLTIAANATYSLIRNAGHGCTTDQPEVVLRIVNKFVDNNKN